MKLKTENQQEKKINENKTWFFKMINKIDKPITRLTKLKREKMQNTNINDKREDCIINHINITKIKREYYE